jgi:hypothetical protein
MHTDTAGQRRCGESGKVTFVHEMEIRDDWFDAYLDDFAAKITRLCRRATIELAVITVLFFAAMTTTVLVVPSMIDR